MRHLCTPNYDLTPRSAECYTLLPKAAVVLAAFCAMGRPSLAHADTYRVGPGQSYTNLSAVAAKLSPGDVVEVQGNTTYEGGVLFNRPGSPSAKITIRGVLVNGKRPVVSGGTNTIEMQGSHYVLEGLELVGGSSRCLFHHADDITVRDTVIHDCPSHGILGADSDSGSLTLQYVEVYGSGSADKRHQIYMATDETAYPGSVFRMEHCYVHDGVGGNNVKSRAERNEIYYNWIEGALYHELELIGPDGQDPELVREDSDVVGNVLRKTRSGYIARVGGDGTGDTSGRYRFVNNTIWLADGSSTVFRIFDSIESIEMHNNVVYSPAGAVRIYTDADASWVTGSAIIEGTRNWFAKEATSVPKGWKNSIVGSSPGFVSPDRWNLCPSPSSLLIGAGLLPTTSPAGHPFPSPLAAPLYLPPRHALEALDRAVARSGAPDIDIGAYEHEAPALPPPGGDAGEIAVTDAGKDAADATLPNGSSPEAGKGDASGADARATTVRDANSEATHPSDVVSPIPDGQSPAGGDASQLGSNAEGGLVRDAAADVASRGAGGTPSSNATADGSAPVRDAGPAPVEDGANNASCACAVGAGAGTGWPRTALAPLALLGIGLIALRKRS